MEAIKVLEAMKRPLPGYTDDRYLDELSRNGIIDECIGRLRQAGNQDPLLEHIPKEQTGF